MGVAFDRCNSRAACPEDRRPDATFGVDVIQKMGEAKALFA